VIRDKQKHAWGKKKVRISHMATSTAKFNLSSLYNGQHNEFLVIVLFFGLFSMTNNLIS